MSWNLFRSRTFYFGATAGFAASVYYHYSKDKRGDSNGSSLISNLSVTERLSGMDWRPPTRSSLINRLKGMDDNGHATHSKDEPTFDLLIIGGGASGTGCALDGAARGLKVACVEKGDFSCGTTIYLWEIMPDALVETSSKSTKLVHGGIRYLEKAFLKLDWDQYKLVREALSERSTFLQIAPHLAGQLPIMLPLYKWYKVPYYWVGAKVYDFLAGDNNLESSYYINRSKALEAFPMLRRNDLVGALVYYDGQSNDARVNVSLALTAIQKGATVSNYTEVVELLKGDDGKLKGAMVKDNCTGETFKVSAKGIINATGPFCDRIRQMDDPSLPTIVAPSTGAHIIFPGYYSPREMGLVDPSTSDGRVIFFLPWEGNTIAGTTDTPSEVQSNPKATKDDINFIVNEVTNYLDPIIKVRKSDVLAAWSGIRPLIRNPASTNTEELVRNHIVMVSPSNLVTIAGGKWTTYRQMAEETIDEAIKIFDLKPKLASSPTKYLPLIGAHGYSDNMYLKLIQQYGLETEVALHLARSYGDRAFIVASLSKNTGKRWPIHGTRLVSWYPYIEAEVAYAVRHEYAQTAVDVLARRLRLAFLSCQASVDALPKVIEIMQKELDWDSARSKLEYDRAIDFLKAMGLEDTSRARAEFSDADLKAYNNIFRQNDPYDCGRINKEQIVDILFKLDDSITPFEWKRIIKSVDTFNTETFTFNDLLEAISTGRNNSTFKTEDVSGKAPSKAPERSGGSL